MDYEDVIYMYMHMFIYTHIYTYIFIPFAANWMDLEMIIQASLVDRTEKNLPAMREAQL